jgi:8-oxo-dGTP diphosphatase
MIVPVLDSKYYFRVPQKACIKKGSKYLVIKRSSSAEVHPNQWDFPGGKLEHGEDPIMGVKREVLEEVGLSVKIKSPLFVYLETCVEPAYVVVFDCKLLGGAVKISKEHSEFKWASKKEIRALKCEPYLEKFFEEK